MNVKNVSLLCARFSFEIKKIKRSKKSMVMG
jgi:hypothetical protein